MKNIQEQQDRFNRIETNLKISKAQMAKLKGGITYDDCDGI